MNKKGNWSTGQKFLMVLVTVVALGFLLELVNPGLLASYFSSKTVSDVVTTETRTTTTIINQPSATKALVDCPNGLTTNGVHRYENIGASTTTYIGVEGAFLPKSPGQARLNPGNSTATSTYSSAVALTCRSTDPTIWEPATVTLRASSSTNGATSSNTNDGWLKAWADQQKADGKTPIVTLGSVTSAGDTVRVDFKGYATDQLQVRVKDLKTDKYLNNSNGTTAEPGFTSLSGILTFRDNAGDTSLTIGADQKMELQFYLKTNSTRTVFGEPSLRTFLCVDKATNSDYDEPIVSVSGTKLVNTYSSLAEDDRIALGDFDYCYSIGQVTDAQRIIDFTMQSATGVNPDADPIIRFISEGRYNSVKNADQIKVGAFKDNSDRDEVAQLPQQSVLIEVN